MQKEITVKRMSAFKFKIEISVGMRNTEMRSIEAPVGESEGDGTVGRIGERTRDEVQNRISVIRKAPPVRLRSEEAERSVKNGGENGRIMCRCKTKTEDSSAFPPWAILINDAIWYRIIEILLWEVLGEKRLTYWGYPKTPTYRLLWKIVYSYSYLQPGTFPALAQTLARRNCLEGLYEEGRLVLGQDHDCQGDINCFMEHVRHFLYLCAPTRELKEKFGWIGLSWEEILKKIYYEDLLPILSKSDLANHPNILESYKDILMLQKWQQQGFTAISWIGHRHFSRLRSRYPWCLQCCGQLRKSFRNRKRFRIS